MNGNEKAIAERLIQIEAVKLNVEKPFMWSSGWKSPIYCDNRKILSFPYVRDFIKSELSNLIFSKYPHAEAVAGVATAGIAWGALVADQLKLPFIYVRPKPKEHGMGNQIEGYYTSGQKMIIVEDLISTGKSSIQVNNVLKQEGVLTLGVISIFNYGFPDAEKAFQKAGLAFHSLTNYEVLIKHAIEKDIVSPQQLNTLLNWSADPSRWKGNE